MAPFTRYFAQMIALLPAVQAMSGRVLMRFLFGSSVVIAAPGPQFLPECVEHMRDVVVELLARKRARGGQLRIAVDRVTPRGEDRRLAVGQMPRQAGQLFIDLVGAVHWSAG